MADRGAFPPGAVDWSGENPGMYLRESEDGPFVTLISFFRVVVSPHGPGRGLVLLEAPDSPRGSETALNVCVTDNEPLARYLAENFVAHFFPFRGKPGLKGMDYRTLHEVTTSGDYKRNYVETIKGDGIEARLSWEELGEPYMADVGPDQSATGKHEMFTCFVDAHRVDVTINGRKAKGRSVPRDFAGRRAASAFLAFSETWLRV